MSDLTTCNFCDLKRMRRNNKGKSKIYLRGSRGGGVNVYKVPNGEKLPPRSEMIEASEEYPNGNKAHEKYFAAWFMSLSNHCEC